jgi:hypothetical protein
MAGIEQIGTAAGVLWRFLKTSGPATLYAIERGVDLPKPMVSMALGWLAREGKVRADATERSVRYAVID